MLVVYFYWIPHVEKNNFQPFAISHWEEVQS